MAINLIVVNTLTNRNVDLMAAPEKKKNSLNHNNLYFEYIFASWPLKLEDIEIHIGYNKIKKNKKSILWQKPIKSLWHCVFVCVDVHRC